MSQKQAAETIHEGQTEQSIQTPPPSVVRAEQLMTNWGHRIGFFIGMTRQRLQNTMTSIHDEVERMNQPEQEPQSANGASSSPTTTVQPTPAGQDKAQVVTQRAEQLVDGFAQRVGAFTAATELQIRRAGAFVREDTEDIWAEAQSIHNQRSHSAPVNNNQVHQ